MTRSPRLRRLSSSYHPSFALMTSSSVRSFADRTDGANDVWKTIASNPTLC